MFHHSTTIHHSYRQFTGFTGREARVVHLGKVAEMLLKARVAGSYMSPIGRMFKLYSYFLGWPLIVGGAKLAAKGVGKAFYGIEWTGHAAKEVIKGGAQITAKPAWLLAYSRLVAIKRMMVDVPIATFSAALRTPIAIATSPIQAVLGVRDAIKNIPKNASEIYNAVTDFKIGGLISGTRNVISDALKPITRPAGKILSPLYNVANTALGAELQTLNRGVDGVKSMFEGVDTIRNCGNVATAEMAVIYESRLAIKAAREKEKQEKREAIKAQIADAKGEGGGGGGAKKAA